MYKHILIETLDNSYDFFNVKEFEYEDSLESYKLLSQNNEYHFFPKCNVKRVVV